MPRKSVPAFYALALSLLVAVPQLFSASATTPAPIVPTRSGAGSLTFFVASDLHYGWPKQGSNVLQCEFIQALNATPGISYPQTVGGSVSSPRGVLLLGDLIQDASKNNLPSWEKDWGTSAERLIQFPVYEGIGNHDAMDSRSWSHLKERNARRSGIDCVSSNGYHYSWTWSGIHFVMLNISPAEKHGLEFLEHDLEQNVGNTGEPVILLQHYAAYAGKRWPQPQMDAFHQVVKDYNIVCIMHGHTHAAKAYKWRGIDVLDDGSLKSTGDKKRPAGFMVVQIEGHKLTAVTRTIQGKWGKVMLQKTFARTAAEMARN